jgi:hypothetical protein
MRGVELGRVLLKQLSHSFLRVQIFFDQGDQLCNLFLAPRTLSTQLVVLPTHLFPLIFDVGRCPAKLLGKLTPAMSMRLNELD